MSGRLYNKRFRYELDDLEIVKCSLTRIAAATGAIQVVDTTASNAPQRYYRVVVSP